MSRFAVLAACAVATCASPIPPGGPAGHPAAQRPATAAPAPAVPAAAPPPPAPVLAVAPAPAPPPTDAERRLKGSTHVHARPSGDSSTPIPDVIDWYARHGYDFIVLTDHNRVSVVDDPRPGAPTIHAPATGPLVFAGVELTHNPVGCLPPGDPQGRCRIHVNLLGVTARPAGKLEWAARGTRERLAKYEAALAQQRVLGGIAQLNHPTWYWGMTAELLTALARRGVPLVEIANVQFAAWNEGDATHPGIEALWDAALAQGVTLWGVASDDAHDYARTPTAQYPAGGGWVMVRARRDPRAILDALAAGRFYASTGVELARAAREGEELVIEIAPGARGPHAVAWIEGGAVVARAEGLGGGAVARRALPARGYLRAVVTRSDGARAWVQPQRLGAPGSE